MFRGAIKLLKQIPIHAYHLYNNFQKQVLNLKSFQVVSKFRKIATKELWLGICFRNHI